MVVIGVSPVFLFWGKPNPYSAAAPMGERGLLATRSATFVGVVKAAIWLYDCRKQFGGTL
jgi:hypothetical protein